MALGFFDCVEINFLCSHCNDVYRMQVLESLYEEHAVLCQGCQYSFPSVNIALAERQSWFGFWPQSQQMLQNTVPHDLFSDVIVLSHSAH